MIKINIIKEGILTNSAQFQTRLEADSWLEKCEAVFTFGKPEHQAVDIPEQRIYHEAIPEVLYQVAIDAVVDENGNEISPAIPEVLAANAVDAYTEIIPATYVTIPSEYSVEIQDITIVLQQETINQEALKYLADTDWYVTRFAETGISIPTEIRYLRAQARKNNIRI